MTMKHFANLAATGMWAYCIFKSDWPQAQMWALIIIGNEIAILRDVQ